MRRNGSLIGILLVNCLALALVIMLAIAKWGVADKQTVLLVMIGCFVLGIWNAVALIDSILSIRKKQ
ncbi:hypothetical protein [Alkalicoccobacillus murimartini]|uniref:Uncharacterized protein n=1 Tax=Alkalicoccobacillus murimartini TaxID=171685 RepID=A0ABT9YDL1_9BACI|nr:hypothetical protein [Alkalicoccobacillus murimartini]MDQ0205941.1 hypothetical protein [Alkalicoccobacillus murimartini]